MDESQTNLNYSDIAKQHLKIMNSQIYSNIQEENQNINKNNNSLSHVNTSNIYSNLEIPLYFIDFSFYQNQNQKMLDTNFNNYISYDLKYKVDEAKNIIHAKLWLNKLVSKYHGEFFLDWKEYTDQENNLYWYNEKSINSTWENPLFVFLTLVENKINKEWIPIEIKSLEDNFIQICFSNKRELYINKSNKSISDVDPRLKKYENISCQEVIKEMIHSNIKKSFIDEKNVNLNKCNFGIIHQQEIKNDDKSISEIREEFIKEIEDFKYLLKDKSINKFSIYDRELPKLIYDERYNKLHSDLRKIIFDEYVKSISLESEKKDKNGDKLLNRKQGQENLKILIRKAIESGDLNLNTSFTNFQEKYQDDHLFCDSLPVDREFLFNEAKLKLKKILQERKNKSIEKFKQMLSKLIPFDIIEEDTNYKDIKFIIKSDPEYKLITSKSERKSIIKLYLEEMKKIKSHSKKYTIEPFGDYETKKRKIEIDVSEDEFKNLMREKIKSEIFWEEAERKYGNEERWKNPNLTQDRKIELFKDYIFNMREIRKNQYKNLLQEKIVLNQEITWHEAQHMLQKDERFREVHLKDRELLFLEHMAYVQEKITQEFSAFLDHTNLINKDSPTEGIPFRDLVSLLSSDLRCQRMYKHPDKRDKLIRMKIKTLKFLFEKQQREERKNNYRYKSEEQTSKWEKGNVIK